ncbi:UDP-N-acetylglucosamine 2-epimerase [Candidatus Moduliflexus flocculans]|uniref:UDP-N-acetylglucosamine 2-epimerase n=1 Tax=Candidatus Moduliflexus flocculans TaxID=1499966 RepID=A0A0S6W3D9_9BACT|nr:UDP-N-acetylglucosamine 2-epimerase [Candidatus Moduliflexus flocculans]
MRAMKIVTVVGARPQFVKAAVVSRAIQAHNAHCEISRLTEVIVHTGQHYDETMSQIFFEEMEIPTPAYNLGVGSGSHAAQTGEILMKLEPVLLAEQPDVVLVYGDTNSTLAAALAAAKLNMPIGHVEAGLRSYNRAMPEEINRILTDHISTFLFCPTPTSVSILRQEGITQGVHLTGDVMFDASLHYAAIAETRSNALAQHRLLPQHYYLATVHRPVNADVMEQMQHILRAFCQFEFPVVFPVHPRTQKIVEAILAHDGDFGHVSQLRLIEPVGYFDMLTLEKHARAIITDSGGVQKEAYFFRVPCVTLRQETEWVETVETGWNRLCAIDEEEIVARVRSAQGGEWIPVFGDGAASAQIVNILLRDVLSQ